MAMPEYDLEKLPEVIVSEIRVYTRQLIIDSIKDAAGKFRTPTTTLFAIMDKKVKQDWVGYLVGSLVDSMAAFKSLSLKYKTDLNSLLRQFTFTIEPGEQGAEQLNMMLTIFDAGTDEQIKEAQNRLKAQYLGAEIKQVNADTGKVETVVLDVKAGVNPNEMQEAADKLSKYFANRYIDEELGNLKTTFDEWIKKVTKKLEEGK